MAGTLDAGLLTYGVLGPVEARSGDCRVELSPGGRAEKIIAILLVRHGEHVSVRELAELLGTTEGAVHTAVYRLRATFEAAGLELPIPSRPKAGYQLEIARGQIDANRFWDLADWAADAFTRGDLEAALEHLDRALALWRGKEPLGGLDFPSFRQASRMTQALKTRRLGAELKRCDLNLDLNRPWKALALAQDLAEDADHQLSVPVHERLVISESRTLGPMNALDTCKAFRDRLDSESCSSPGPRFNELQAKFSNGVAA